TTTACTAEAARGRNDSPSSFLIYIHSNVKTCKVQPNYLFVCVKLISSFHLFITTSTTLMVVFICLNVLHASVGTSLLAKELMYRNEIQWRLDKALCIRNVCVNIVRR